MVSADIRLRSHQFEKPNLIGLGKRCGQSPLRNQGRFDFGRRGRCDWWHIVGTDGIFIAAPDEHEDTIRYGEVRSDPIVNGVALVCHPCTLGGGEGEGEEPVGGQPSTVGGHQRPYGDSYNNQCAADPGAGGEQTQSAMFPRSLQNPSPCRTTLADYFGSALVRNSISELDTENGS